MPVTIQNIADRVGVSKQAVSSALNAKPGQVSEQTRKRILAAAQSLGYQPNFRARSFARKRSQIIGLVYGRPADYVERSEVVSALVEKLAAVDHELLLIPATGPVDRWAHKLRDGRVDGCLVTHPMPEGLDDFIADHSVPAVLLNLRSDADVPQVSFDDRQGTQLAMDHLFELGHHRIAYYCLPKTHGLHYSNIERQNSYAEAMSRAQLTAHKYSTIEQPDAWAREFAALPPDQRPTAVLAYNDFDAFHLCRELSELGFDVPGDISCVCFNNGFFSSLSKPRLTTVAMSDADAVDYCLSRLLPNPQTTQVPDQLILPQRLSLGQSTAPPPAGLS
jgi:DNA-binding LacI/PurR family transcriptional regulator